MCFAVSALRILVVDDTSVDEYLVGFSIMLLLCAHLYMSSRYGCNSFSAVCNLCGMQMDSCRLHKL